MKLISKIKYYKKLKRYFKLIEDFLDDGYYCVNDKKIIKTKPTDTPFHKRFKIKSKGQKLYLYQSGSLFFTEYKSGLLTSDKAFYFIKDSERYFQYKNNYFKYKQKLSYPSLDLDFCDERMLVSGKIIEGNIYKDLSHFDTYLGLLFQYAEKNSYNYKKVDFNDSVIELPWYVQHGDCKNANIVWQGDDSFIMIDLEAIDLYPPLYDVFYYLFITRREESIDILKSNDFCDKVCKFFAGKLIEVPNNILDICLANYAYFTASKLNKDSELYEFEFYLFWRKYDSFDDLPITKKVLEDYKEKLNKYGIK